MIMTGPMASSIDDFMKTTVGEGNDQGAFDDVFAEDDLLGEPAYHGSIGDFNQSRDFSMSAGSIGEDEFGVFECQPHNSMVGSISNNESFACSSPVSHVHLIKSANVFQNFAPIEESSSLTAEDLCNEAEATVDDTYVSFSDIAQEHQTNSMNPSIDLSGDTLQTQLSRNETITDQHRNFNTSPRRTISSHFPNDSSGRLNENMNFQQQHSDHFSPKRSHSNNSHFQSVHIPTDPTNQISQNHVFNSVANPIQGTHQHPLTTMQQQSQMQDAGVHQQYIQNTHSRQHQISPYQVNQQALLHQSHPQQAGILNHMTPAVLNNSSHDGSFRNLQHSMQGNASQNGNFLHNSTHGTNFQTNSPSLSSQSAHGRMYHNDKTLGSKSFHGIPYQNSDRTMINNNQQYPSGSQALHASFHFNEQQRRNSDPFNIAPTTGNSSFSGMQMNVAIPSERYSSTKTYFHGYESQSPSPIISKNPPSNMNDVMEKLSESMRRSAMSRNMVKHISGRGLVSQNSSRSLLASQGSTRSMSRNNSTRNLANQGSERSVGVDGGVRTLPIRRMSSSAKHQLPVRSLHRHDSLRSLNHSTHGTINVQIDGRNIGTL